VAEVADLCTSSTWLKPYVTLFQYCKTGFRTRQTSVIWSAAWFWFFCFLEGGRSDNMY